MLWLRRLGAPRVLTAPMLVRIVDSLRPGISRRTVSNLAAEMVKDGRLEKVRRGLYLNLWIAEPPSIAEAAQYVRSGAIVSLHTVLGDAGVLNNYTHDVWCVVPLMRGVPQTSLRSVHLEDGRMFVFHGIPEMRLFGPKREHLLDTVLYPRATLEAALCHWIYLWQSPRSSFTKLPFDLDLEDVDLKRAERIARAMGIAKAFAAWYQNADLHYEQGVGPLGF
jgi:hypothetical protein